MGLEIEMTVATGPWPEAEYQEYLASERHMFAWVLVRYGSIAEDRAEELARERYPTEPADAPYRGLIFHDEAWHWGMLALRGEHYWIAAPSLESPPPEYRAEQERWDAASQAARDGH